LAGFARTADGGRVAGEGPALAARPNPARATMQFTFYVPHSERVELAIYDVGGRRVKIVTESNVDARRVVRGWDLTDDSGAKARAGIYLARLRSGSAEAITRFVVLP